MKKKLGKIGGIFCAILIISGTFMYSNYANAEQHEKSNAKSEQTSNETATEVPLPEDESIEEDDIYLNTDDIGIQPEIETIYLDDDTYVEARTYICTTEEQHEKLLQKIKEQYAKAQKNAKKSIE